MVNFITGLFTLATPFLVFFNWTGGIIGGIWLLLAGQWKLVFGTAIVSFFFPSVYGIINLPICLIFKFSTDYFSKKRMKIPVLIIGFLSLSINSILEFLWVAIVFMYMVKFAAYRNISLLPILLYSYSLATGPFVYMDNKEPEESYGSHVAVLTVELIAAILVILHLVNAVYLFLPIALLLFVLINVALLKISSELLDNEWEQEAIFYKSTFHDLDE